jgi:hypothetical protein
LNVYNNPGSNNSVGSIFPAALFSLIVTMPYFGNSYHI